MAGEYVFRVARADRKGDFILAQTTPTGSASRPLSVKVVATDGAAPYVVSIKQNHIDRLREKNSSCSEEEWEQILSSVLLGRGSVQDVDATATVDEGSSLAITFYKRIDAIAQRLGTLTLNCNEDEAIELFEWCSTALEVRAQVQQELAKAQAKAEGLESAVNDLRSQLEELVAVKSEDETVLLEKFRALLNEKKLKIREQQTIIDSFGNPRRRRNLSPGPTTHGSRAAKRKGGEEPSEVEESDNDLEKMLLDVKREEMQESHDEQTTDGEANASEADEKEDILSPPAITTQKPTKKQEKTTAPASEGSEGPASQGGSEIESDDEL